MGEIRISDSAQFKQQVAEVRKREDLAQTNLKPTPATEQEIFKRAYGADGAQLTGHETINYNPFSTILPDSAIDRNERRKKKRFKSVLEDQEEEEQEEKPKPKHSFWEDLFADD
jgi:hypothetical protein